MSQRRVFITLGHDRQVVERGGAVPENYRESTDIGPRSRSKRSRRDTLGGYPDGSSLSSKRQRGAGAKWGPGGNQKEGDRKRISLHEQLSESPRPSASNSRLQLRPEAKGSFILGKISSTQNGSIVHQVNSMKKINYSSIVNGFELRSPDTLLKSARELKPPRNYDGPKQFPSMKAVDAPTAKPFLGNGGFDTSRPTGFITTAITVDNVKPATQLTPMNGIEEKISRVREEALTVSGLLHALGLGKYEIIFCGEVDMTALKQMEEKDLKDIGIPMGPRKKMLLALAPRLKQQPPQGRNPKQLP